MWERVGLKEIVLTIPPPPLPPRHYRGPGKKDRHEAKTGLLFMF